MGCSRDCNTLYPDEVVTENLQRVVDDKEQAPAGRRESLITEKRPAKQITGQTLL